MSKAIFDLDLLDYEAQRKLQRKKLLLRSAVPVALAFIICLWALLPYLFTAKSIIQYSDSDYTSAQAWVRPLLITSPNRFIALYNNGTVNIQLQNYQRAEDLLSQALIIAPDYAVCMTAQNFVYSLSKHANFTKDEYITSAINAKAKDTVHEYPDCFIGSASQAGGSGSGSSGSMSESLSDNQQDELEQKEQEGREKRAQFAREEEFNLEDPNVKRW